MDPATQTDVPNPGEHEQQDWEDAVDLVLQDMQDHLPDQVDPETRALMRYYLATRLSRFPNTDNLVRRNVSLNAEMTDAANRLSALTRVTYDLAEAMAAQGPAQQAVLQELDFSPASFLAATRQLTALEVKLLQYDTDQMKLRNENETLQERLSEAQRLARDRDQALQLARSTLERREEELKRTRHILERVEAQRNTARRTADYLIPQLGDLQTRLEESKKLQKSAEDCSQSLMSALSKQGVTHGLRALPVVAYKPTPATELPLFAGLRHGRGPMAIQSAKFESIWARILKEDDAKEWKDIFAAIDKTRMTNNGTPIKDTLITNGDAPVEETPKTNGDAPVEETLKMNGDASGEETLKTNGDALVKKPARPNQVIPAVPELPPNQVMRANSAKKLKEELAKAGEKVSLSSKATVSHFFLTLVEMF
ncbi:hypothetical protein Daus18300_012973 [Diaporthe australafricana]|uniref:Uncharacterized protein n=1 Tax=Diaporthe australafricana TaxID=127596 RepID=A0ABR3W0V9_9PEZI